MGVTNCGSRWYFKNIHKITKVDMNDATQSLSKWPIIRLILISAFLILIVFAASYWFQSTEITANWEKYRCDPSIMPFASFFGHNTSENFNYCMTHMFKGHASVYLGPIFDILGTIISTFSIVISSLSSIRLMMANIVNSATSILTDMQSKLYAVMMQLRTSFFRMQTLMQRLYATFYAIIYMGTSGINAATTFGNTTVGGFLDTFCFHPSTIVHLQNPSSASETKTIADVRIGDILDGPNGTTHHVSSTLKFDSVHQKNSMYLLNGIIVSGNHYVIYNKKWIPTSEHPDAKHIEWDSTISLICLNTSTGQIPIKNNKNEWEIFTDYDEDDTVDHTVMIEHERILGSRSEQPYLSREYAFDYSLGIGPRTRIVMSNENTKLAKDILIGDETKYGKVLGIIDEKCDKCVRIWTGELMSEATMVWNENGYTRAGLIKSSVYVGKPRILRNFIIENSGIIEIAKRGGGGSSVFIRDYMELAGGQTQKIYETALKNFELTETFN